MSNKLRGFVRKNDFLLVHFSTNDAITGRSTLYITSCSLLQCVLENSHSLVVAVPLVCAKRTGREVYYYYYKRKNGDFFFFVKDFTIQFRVSFLTFPF